MAENRGCGGCDMAGNRGCGKAGHRGCGKTGDHGPLRREAHMNLVFAWLTFVHRASSAHDLLPAEQRRRFPLWLAKIYVAELVQAPDDQARSLAGPTAPSEDASAEAAVVP